MSATEYVVLVDHEDREIGLAEKLSAHEQGLLHRAFSVFLFSDHTKTRLLLQQRAPNKYHSGNRWTNACCSHPRPNESILAAGTRRLKEELGIETTLHHKGHFIYKAHFENGLSEHELDHVLIGFVPETTRFHLNPAEAQAVQWIATDALQQALEETPEQFTPWLKEALRVACKTTHNISA